MLKLFEKSYIISSVILWNSLSEDLKQFKNIFNLTDSLIV